VTELTEPLDEPRPSEEVPEPVDPVDAERELARRNTRFGIALFGLFLLLFAGIWVVAFIYLALD
jgi:hypothetical protein